MKKLVFSLSALFIIASAMAQEVGKAIVDYNGQNYPALVREYSNSQEVVIAALKSKMEAAGNKLKSDKKDWLVYRGALMMNNGQNVMSDVLIKVEPKSRNEKGKSMVYFISTKPGVIPEDKIKKSDKLPNAANIELYSGGTEWLNTSVSNINTQQHLVNVQAQQEVLDKTEKKLKELESDKTKLEKRLADLQKDIENNRVAIESQKSELEKEKAKLETLKQANPGS